jgi:hypothetical protein
VQSGTAACLAMVEKSDNASATERAASERRRHPRYPFTAAVEAIEAKSQTKVHGRVSDLGRGGCFVDMVSPLPIGAVVDLCITRENKSFRAKGKVVYSMMGMGMGLSFVNAEPEQLWTLEKWIGELGGGFPSEVETPAEETAAGATPEDRGEGGSGKEAYYVLTELVIELMRLGVLSEAKGKEMLGNLVVKQVRR